MVAQCLVTTANESTWPQNRPVLFLGEWCKLYSRKIAWEKLDSRVAPYHWDDREKLYTDYLYIRKTYEEQLKELRLQLNLIHDVDHSLRYWRILVGPWLGFFLQMLFDRWFMLKQVIEEKEVDACIILDRSEESYIPNDMADFCQFFTKDDWNEKVYSQLIEICWKKKFL